MALRSWLFVPGDSEKKLGKAAAVGADALILDLEDSVVIPSKPRARELTAAWLKAHRVGRRRSGALGADQCARQPDVAR